MSDDANSIRIEIGITCQSLQSEMKMRPPKLTAGPRLSPKAMKALHIQQMLNEGMMHHNAERYEEAELIYSKVLQEAPSNAEALLLLGMLSLDLNLDSIAVDYLRKAMRKTSRDVRIISKLSEALHKSSRANEALLLINKAIALQNNYLPFKYKKAQILADLGRVDESVELLRTLLELNPDDAEAVTAIAHIMRFKGSEPELETLRQMCEWSKLNSKQKGLIHLARSKVEADIKNYEASIDAAIIGRAALVEKFDLDAFRESVTRMINFFTRDFLESRREMGDPSDRPVFIFGMPRSGTTLTEQIVASHPLAYGAGELLDMNNIAVSLGATSPDFVAHYQFLLTISAREVRGLAASYLKRLNQLSANAVRVTDKLPHNFVNAGLIALLFPNAMFIHCRRNPIDNCVSIFTSPLDESHAYNRDLETLGLYYREYDRLTKHWEGLLSDRILTVQYEDTVADLETQAHRIIAHCKLEWDDRCLEFHKTERSVSTISRDQVRRPIYTSSVDRWKRYGPKLAPLISALGPLAKATD